LFDFNHLSTFYDIPQSDFLKYHSLKSSISRNIKLQGEVEVLSYTAPSYFTDKIHQNTKFYKHVHQLVIKQKAPREIEKWTMTLLEDYIA